MITRLLALFCCLAPLLPAAETPKTRPNIVFIFADDVAYQAISAYGDPRKLPETPSIDRIAREGMRFDRCLVTNSICGPSRATVLTGLYSHLNGFVNNADGAKFDGSQVTFPKLLQGAGYQTAIIGKWHLGSNPTGFDYWHVLQGQGLYYDPIMMRNGVTGRVKGYISDIVGDESIDWLKQRDRTKPFLLMAQHKASHRVWQAAVRHLDFDHGRVYAEPATLFDDYAGRGPAENGQTMTIAQTMDLERDLKMDLSTQKLPPEYQAAFDAYYNPRNEAFKAAKLQGKDLVRWKYQRYMHDYLATVHGADENIGKLLDYLDQEGLSENTIVVFASDQGFYLGEHGWFDKRWMFEESVRTPFLVRWPGVVKPGSINRDLVSTLDFAETFLEAAGVAVPASMQGRSLVPVLAGKTPTDWRKSFYYQYFEYPAWHRVSPHYGVVTDRYKLMRFFGPVTNYSELFDLQKDPSEMRSVYDDPAYASQRQELEKELGRLRKELKVPEEIPFSWYGDWNH